MHAPTAIHTPKRGRGAFGRRPACASGRTICVESPTASSAAEIACAVLIGVVSSADARSAAGGFVDARRGAGVGVATATIGAGAGAAGGGGPIASSRSTAPRARVGRASSASDTGASAVIESVLLRPSGWVTDVRSRGSGSGSGASASGAAAAAAATAAASGLRSPVLPLSISVRTTCCSTKIAPAARARSHSSSRAGNSVDINRASTSGDTRSRESCA